MDVGPVTGLDTQIIIDNLWSIVAAVGAIAGILVVAAVGFFLLLSKFKIKPKQIGPIQFLTEESAQKFTDSLILLDELKSDILKQMYFIEFVEILRRQMREVEIRVAEIIDVMRNTQVEIIALSMGKDKAVESEAVARYRVMTEFIEIILTKTLRTAMRENHLADRTENEFRDYISNKSRELMRIIDDTITTIYIPDVVSLHELKESHKKSIPEYNEILRALFIEARTISKNGKGSIDKLKKRYRELTVAFLTKGEVYHSSKEPVEGACDDDEDDSFMCV
jgi:hypothetical protein